MKCDIVRAVGKFPKSKPELSKMEKSELSKFFRDEELFNPEKDRVTADYFKYSEDDCPIHINRHDPAFDIFIADIDRMFDRMG